MKSLRFLDRRAGFSLGAIGLLLGIVAPAALPALASAGNLTSRSVTMTSAAALATSVGYTVQFTVTSSVAVGGGFVMQFCNSATGPLLAQSCVEPAGMSIGSLSGVTAEIDTGSGFAAASSNGTLTSANETTPGTSNDNYVKWVSGSGDALAAGNKLKVSFTGVTNPSGTGTFYARIYTYNAAPNFTDSTNVGTTADTGSVALSTSAGVGVTAYVQESMTFCVSHSAPTANCAGTDSPSRTIGQTVGTTQVLSATTVSSDTDYMQLSTNAGSGATVNLQSDAASCGGLKLVGSSGCIPGQNVSANDLANYTPGFGLKLGTAADASGATNTTGTIVNATATNAHYSTTKYYIDSASDNSSGVTSTYGSPFVDSAGAPVSNKNLSFTFGAIIGNQTPAGQYKANLNMIATGTF